MQLIQSRRGWTLRDIRQEDIKYCNLAATPTKSRHYDPNKPQHVISVWLDDPAIADALKNDMNYRVNETEFQEKDENGEIIGVRTRKFLQFKAYPKMKQNAFTGKMQPDPKVIMKSPDSDAIPIGINSFKLVDGAVFNRFITSIDIVMRPWQYAAPPEPPVAVISELWVEYKGGDINPAEEEDEYFKRKYGYINEPDTDAPPEDELPWGN